MSQFNIQNVKILSLAFICFLSYLDSSAQIRVKETKKGFHFTNVQGKRISDKTFEAAKNFGLKSGTAAVKINGKWGFVNENIELIIPAEYDHVHSFLYGAANVKKEGQHYLINKDGEQLTSTYDSLIYYKKNYIAINEGKYGIISSKDSTILPIQFESFGGETDQAFIVKKEGEWGHFIDGEFVVAEDEISFTRYEKAPVLVKECLDEKSAREIEVCSQRSLLMAVYRNLKYPAEARESGIQGTAIIQFTINKFGKMENPNIKQDLEGGCGEAALKVVIEQLENWAQPAYMDGKPIDILYTLPVRFKLEG